MEKKVKGDVERAGFANHTQVVCHDYEGKKKIETDVTVSIYYLSLIS